MLVSRRTDRRSGPAAEAEVGGMAVLRPDRDLDAQLAPDIRRAALELPRGTRLIIDLGATPFIDSVGVGLLIAITRAVTGRGGSVVLAGPRSPVARVLRVTGVDEIIAVTETFDDAVRLLSTRSEGPVGREWLSQG